MNLEVLIAENYVFRAVVYGLIPAATTSLGGLVGLMGFKASEKWLDIGLSFSAGIMLGTSLYELLPSSIEKSGYLIGLLAFITGVIFIAAVELFIPHEHVFKGYEGAPSMKSRLKSIYLILLAILIHNIPEGMAVGTLSYLDIHVGLATAISIAVQDFPEGYAVSFPLSMISKSRSKPFLIALLSGLSETLMAVLATLATSVIAAEGFLLGLTSGAMLYIVSHEVIPETHRYGYEAYATAGFISGFVLSIALLELL